MSTKDKLEKKLKDKIARKLSKMSPEQRAKLQEIVDEAQATQEALNLRASRLSLAVRQVNNRM